MTKNLLIISALALGVAFTSNAFVVDWDKIEHWAGEGDNCSALVVQFDDNGPEEAYVWGFRWNPDDYPGGAPSGEDMFRAIVAESRDLLLFTQFTGSLGSTVDGIGYFDPDGPSLAEQIEFNFDSAKVDPRISFDYFVPNTLMKQTKAPGNFTPVYCSRALTEAVESRIIEHPVNAREYGYPAYDYDWWQPASLLDREKQRWNAGWYDGYWSYWVGGVNSEELSYSGLGYSSRKLANGQVDAWKYTFLDGPVTDWSGDGSTGASSQWHKLNYHHFNPQSASEEIVADDALRYPVAIFDLQGSQRSSGSTSDLPAGVYVMKYSDGSSTKIMIKR